MSQSLVYKGKYIQVYEKIINNQVWEMSHFRESCVIFALNDQNQMLMINEYRPHENPPQRLKFVTGHVDSGEDILETAKRELQEEAGFFPHQLHHFHTHRQTGSINSIFHMYVAWDLEENKLPNPDGEETIISTNFHSLDDIKSMILNYQVPWGLSCLGALKIIHSMEQSKGELNAQFIESLKHIQ